MLPLQQAYEVKQSVIEYIKATFRFKERTVHEAFYNFIEDPHNGIIKGPYVSLKTPFVTASTDEEIPLDIKPLFPPYDHQMKSFWRLNANKGHRPESTLLTTGTGSGKTECFLYPILDYCYHNLSRKGIKVIILYPMNALASDQAKRIGEIIWQDERLRGKVTAGLFIGEGKDENKYPKTMGPENIIEDRDTILNVVPDILLTNFKMLDYGLMKSNYACLWDDNLRDPSLFQFLILDELHTYDGAQGTDVANLIRRLKLKVKMPEDYLCAIGTSATIGSGEDSKRLLTKYASDVFGEVFDEDAVITENRLTPEEFFSEEQLRFVPLLNGVVHLSMKADDTYESYIERQRMLWQIYSGNENELGENLKRLKIVQDIVRITSQGYVLVDNLISKLADVNDEFRMLPESAGNIRPREEVIGSLLALIAEAKTGTEKKFPFMYLQVQLWVRELTGVLRKINDEPEFTWRNNLLKCDKKQVAMPAYFCRECGASGWIAVKGDNEHSFHPNASEANSYYFSNHKNIYFLNTYTDDHQPLEEYDATDRMHVWLDKENLKSYDKEQKDAVNVIALRKTNNNRAIHICPECGSENTLSIVGTKVATLASVAISQVMSSDLDKGDDNERKILAFTNSVQDAAHNAGFFESRNYRFTFRSSLQQVLKQQEKPVTLLELQEKFLFYWKKQFTTTDEYIYRFFPADYKGKVNLESDFRNGKGAFTVDFLKEFDTRMSWEIVSEFGYNAQIGRTLEKTGASATFFPEESLRKVYAMIIPWLVENNLEFIDEESFVLFVNGFLHRLRIRGGMCHPYLDKFRENDLRPWDLNWMKDGRHFLNKRFNPKKARFPKLLTTALHNRGILDTTFAKKSNWYHAYFRKSFPLAPDYPGITNDFFKELCSVMTKAGILNEANSDDRINYCIDPTSLMVSNKARHLRCSCCQSILCVGVDDHISEGTKCLDYRCPGNYIEVVDPDLNYYQMVYNRNRSPRIYASEHTGLLDRKKREEIEYSFKKHPGFNSVNALVATSTLEMGIDIGDLNVAMNTSVPPQPSNFMQRVGRAGRKSGAALINNFVQSKSHDLFYYEEPEDMMQGAIHTPGCFLEAKEILSRHFLAFCMDSWTGSNPETNRIPNLVGSLKLMTTYLLSADFFMNRVINFIKDNEKKLTEDFSSMYPEIIRISTLKPLFEALDNESFYIRIKKEFASLQEDYARLSEKSRELNKLITDNKLASSDEKYKALREELFMLRGLLRLMRKSQVLEFMTNAGLLPNYAFPETGVSLKASVRSEIPKGSEGTIVPPIETLEVVRSAGSAIKEMAPGNYFYTQGYKLNISGLNTYDWTDSSVLLKKRFCSNCDCIEDASINGAMQCPKCGDRSWGAASNVHTFVRLKSVKSNDRKSDAMLDDTKDERELVTYKMSRHFIFEKDGFAGAYGMKNIPFGIEYVNKVTLTEVNLGCSESADARHLDINKQKQIPVHGFITCRYCGKSTSNIYTSLSEESPEKRLAMYHYPYCRCKDKEYQQQTDEVFEEVYLFHEMHTEAIKILLPVQNIDEVATVKMFKAGLELGLRAYYQGNPDHLRLEDYEEYNEQNGHFDHYLIMYDTIPGGTGYLAKLFDTSEFTTLLNKAYEQIHNCECQYHGKDGCYRCILTYGNQYIHDQLSREKADKLFEQIISMSGEWQQMKNGLGTMTGEGGLEESELEERFVRSLKRVAKEKNWLFTEKFTMEVKSYSLLVNVDSYRFGYSIYTQVGMGERDGVKYYTISDFQFICTKAEKETADGWQEINSDAVQQMAVYLDGYTYHASKEHLRFFSDFRKREAIKNSGHILSWTLTWEDLEYFDEGNDKGRDSLCLDRLKYKDTIEVLEGVHPHSPLMEENNSMQRLLYWLCHPLEKLRYTESVGMFLALWQDSFGENLVKDELIESALKNDSDISLFAPQSDEEYNFVYMKSFVLPESSLLDSRIFIRISDLNVRYSLFMKEDQKELDREEWNHFWRVYNLLQLCNNSSDYPDSEFSIDQDSIVDCFDKRLEYIVRQLLVNNVIFNHDGGFSLCDEEGIIIADAELGLSEQKIVFLPFDEKSAKVFEDAGYEILQPEEFNIKILNK